MRKKTVFCLYLLPILATMVAMNVVTVNASISNVNWIGPTYRGSDTFLGTTITAYKTGSTVNVIINVYNDYYVGFPYYDYRPVNVSAVKVCPDWNINYTSTEANIITPTVVPAYQYRMFTVSFVMPDTTIASNLKSHSYRIYVEHVNNTAGPKRIVDTWTFSGSGIAVYSAEQADSMQIVQKYTGISTPSFSYPESRVLWTRAQLEASIGSRSYLMGNFTDAKLHYQNMDSLFQQALQTESTKGVAYTDATTYYYIRTPDAATMQSYGYLLMGLGLTLFGVGAIIFGIRKKS